MKYHMKPVSATQPYFLGSFLKSPLRPSRAWRRYSSPSIIASRFLRFSPKRWTLRSFILSRQSNIWIKFCRNPWTNSFKLKIDLPREGTGVKSRMCPPYPQRDRKRRLNGAVCRNHRIKRVVPCRCLDGHVKEPYEMSMALGARP